MTPEKLILTVILQTYGSNPKIRLFRRNVGLLKTDDGRTVRIGERGQADLYGWIVDEGTGEGARHLEIEVKAPRGRLSDHQAAWRAMCRQTGAIYILARSVDDVADGLAEYGYNL